ncbi:MAG: alpha/beta hydrolase family protein [Bryobacterales bacterium]|nr:alpha/beta hydrolase family protein [Bryobacterales bacterium]
MLAWEDRLSRADTDRVIRPFEWGLNWLGIDAEHPDPARRLADYAHEAAAHSVEFFGCTTPHDFELHGNSLRFTSPVVSPYPENNTVWAEWFEAPKANGRAVLVIPQWNSDDGSHIGLCRLLQKVGISSLRLSKAYHHRRKPPEIRRADYHVSANLGRTIHATRQSVLDARCCLDWFASQGYLRIGIIGTSLGSCVALLTVAHDRRVKSAVFNHVSMRFSDVVWTGASCRHIQTSLHANVTLDELQAAWSVISPATYLHLLQGRDLESLLIWGRYDTTFLPEFSQQVLDEFRRRKLSHKVVTLPCGHYSLAKRPFVWMDGYAMVNFLRNTL